MIFEPSMLEFPQWVKEERETCYRQTISAFGNYAKHNVALLVDGNNVMYRLAFATSNESYSTTELMAVFVENIKARMSTFEADVCVCCIDWGQPLRRTVVRYDKKKPEKTPEADHVIANAREALRMMRENKCPLWLNPTYLEGYEGDDVIAANVYGRRLAARYVIYSSDTDLLQVSLGGEFVTQYSPSGKFVKASIPADQVPFVKALAGDVSDGIDGLVGVGNKTALKMITGEIKREITKEELNLVRNNLDMIALPFPGAYQCVVLDPVPYTAETTIEIENFDEEDLPF